MKNNCTNVIYLGDFSVLNKKLKTRKKQCEWSQHLWLKEEFQTRLDHFLPLLFPKMKSGRLHPCEPDFPFTAVMIKRFFWDWFPWMTARVTLTLSSKLERFPFASIQLLITGSVLKRNPSNADDVWQDETCQVQGSPERRPHGPACGTTASLSAC